MKHIFLPRFTIKIINWFDSQLSGNVCTLIKIFLQSLRRKFLLWLWVLEGGIITAEVLTSPRMVNCIQRVPDLMIFQLQLFNFTMVWDQYIFSRNHTWNLEFRSYPRLAMCSELLSRRPGQQSDKLPDGHMITRIAHLQPFCTHSALVFVAFSTVLNSLR